MVVVVVRSPGPEKRTEVPGPSFLGAWGPWQAAQAGRNRVPVAQA